MHPSRILPMTQGILENINKNFDKKFQLDEN